jgi:23S rRNA (adenine2503-C2)-methyltransferase
MGSVRDTLIGQELDDLTALMTAAGERPFRARQLFNALYRRRVDSLTDVTTLPAGLLDRLGEDFEPGLPEVSEHFVSIDGTVRYLLKLADGKTVEAVFIPERDRDTLCISSQVGCAVDCRFCLTALIGLERNLTVGEIVGQVVQLFRQHQLEPRKRPVNIVMMGMGEPLLNLDAVSKALRLMSDADGLAIPLRRITVSTSGIIPKMDEFAGLEHRPRLAVSLNASTQESRERLMPITKKYTLAELIDTCKNYPLRPWERLTFEYVLLEGVNDSDEDARRVVQLLGQIKAKVNLIAFNPGPGMPFGAPSRERVEAFQEIILRSQPCFVRRPRGQDIFAACGQLKRTVS